MGDETAINGTLFDVERIEVLRGPQGTAFGKNTTAGLVHFISVKPTNSPSGYANIQYGSDNEVIAEGAVSGPITNGFRARLAGKMARHDGHYRNRYLGAGDRKSVVKGQSGSVRVDPGGLRIKKKKNKRTIKTNT